MTVKTGSGVGSVENSVTHFRYMKAPADNNCTYDGITFILFDCATEYIDPAMMRLAVETQMVDSKTWGSVVYKVCTKSASSLKATTVETSCGIFEFTSLEATTLAQNKVPKNAHVNGGSVTDVKCAGCTARSVLFLTTSSSIKLGKGLGKYEITSGVWRVMQSVSIDDSCTYNNGFLEFDCETQVDPLKMTLVVQTKYAEAWRTCKSVMVNTCSMDSEIELAGMAVTTQCTEFLFGTLNTLERSPLRRMQTDGSTAGLSRTSRALSARRRTLTLSEVRLLRRGVRSGRLRPTRRCGGT